MYYTNLNPAGMDEPGQQCRGLIELTASTLSSGTVARMLLAEQRDNHPLYAAFQSHSVVSVVSVPRSLASLLLPS
jgi:hypothetical protein